MFGVGVATYLRCPGCIDRARVNANCEWTGDTAFSIDPHNTAHQQHLVADAQLAEDLAIRYSDASFRRGPKRDWRFNVEHRALGKTRVRRECIARMFYAVETNHSVTAEQVQIARGQRNRTFDVAVALLFVPLYSLSATIACRWLRRRFSSDQPYVGLVATGLVSVAVSFLGFQCFRLYAGVWEVIRVGNGHMTSIRAASDSRWPHQYVGADFIGGMVLFWLVVLLCYRAVSADEHSIDVRFPRGILLR
jgi:hypothetical protein